MQSSQKSFKNLRKTFSDLKRSGIEGISEDPVLCFKWYDITDFKDLGLGFWGCKEANSLTWSEIRKVKDILKWQDPILEQAEIAK